MNFKGNNTDVSLVFFDGAGNLSAKVNDVWRIRSNMCGVIIASELTQSKLIEILVTGKLSSIVCLRCK